MLFNDTSGDVLLAPFRPTPKVQAPGDVLSGAVPTRSCAVKFGYCVSTMPPLMSNPSDRSRSTDALPVRDMFRLLPLNELIGMTNSPPIVLEPPMKPAEKFNPTWVGRAVSVVLSGSGLPGTGCVAVRARKPSCAVIAAVVETWR